jgi:hypothetical protein
VTNTTFDFPSPPVPPLPPLNLGEITEESLAQWQRAVYAQAASAAAGAVAAQLSALLDTPRPVRRRGRRRP